MRDEKLIQWNSQQKTLKSILGKEAGFEEAIQLCLKQHSMVHASDVSKLKESTIEDELWNELDEASFRTFVNQDHGTIARNMWHATRIEDITMNLLVAGESQVFKQDNWQEKLNVNIQDTGNAMTDAEVIDFSNGINMEQLFSYRVAVGTSTRAIIEKLTFLDLKQKMEPSRLKTVLDEGAVLDVEGANWLIDFWGRKNVAGILLMPATRHNLVHINQSKRIKLKVQKRKKRTSVNSGL